jgi:hypothetical protein
MPHHTFGVPRILLVEDDLLALEALAYIVLEFEGYFRERLETGLPDGVPLGKGFVKCLWCENEGT